MSAKVMNVPSHRILQPSHVRDLRRENAVLKRRLARALEECRRDGLTGVYNRRHFELLMNRIVHERIGSPRPMTVILVDIDHFKSINDRFGHLIGDLALKHAAQLLVDTVELDGVVCRYGGEEFAILVEDGNEAPASIAERIRAAIEKNPLTLSAGQIDMTVSIGVSSKLAQAGRPFQTQLLKDADDALYRAKANGRNRVEVS
ncbi:MAG TPA: GGDEF domain-containing protein [Caulifigura sp.]|jgi:two-component system cell cycle response regulator|nr:GGDEF domain-containing protein [Caulifigura sp.]